MKALRMRGAGGPEVLEIADVPKPVPGPNELLVRVRAASVNHADLVQRRGLYPPPPGIPEDILGLDYAGAVAEIGEGVTRFKFGDRVFGLVSGAAQAEYVVTHEELALGTPDLLNDIEAAAIPEAYMTANDALFAQAHLQSGERVLIHAIGSGVGLAALQLARAHACSVIGTSRSPWKIERAMQFDLNEGIDAASGKFVDAVLEATEQHGADVIIDFVGGPYLEENLRALALRGRVVFLSTLGGPQATLPIFTLMRKRATLMGSTLRMRGREEKLAVKQAFEKDVLPLFATRRIEVPIDKVFALENAIEAHRYLESFKNFGKVVLQI
jgi:putative PIG3 family NAD(P)H quinone oxidoreductase